MKKIRTIALYAMPLLVAALASCGNDDDSPQVDAVLASTNWVCESSSADHSANEYNNSENKHQLDNVLTLCPSLKYAASETTKTERTDTIDMCKKDNHAYHYSGNLTFGDASCYLHTKTTKNIQVVKRVVEETKYTFEEGSYIGAISPGNYVGVTVKSYGIYRASTSGDILVLPLDGEYGYTVSIKQYEAVQKDLTIAEADNSFSYSRNGLSVVLGDNEWTGSLNATHDQLVLKNYSMGESYVFDKQ